MDVGFQNIWNLTSKFLEDPTVIPHACGSLKIAHGNFQKQWSKPNGIYINRYNCARYTKDVLSRSFSLIESFGIIFHNIRRPEAFFALRKSLHLSTDDNWYVSFIMQTHIFLTRNTAAAYSDMASSTTSHSKCIRTFWSSRSNDAGLTRYSAAQKSSSTSHQINTPFDIISD